MNYSDGKCPLTARIFKLSLNFFLKEKLISQQGSFGFCVRVNPDVDIANHSMFNVLDEFDVVGIKK